jgi:kumamolisin
VLAPLLLVALACCLTIAAGTVSSGSASAGDNRSALAVQPSAWNALLTGARDLGPSRAASADVLVALRGSGRPTAVLRWAAQRGLRATWFPGQPTVLLAAPPAILGRALGVRIDDFRLAGQGVFYASRGTSHVPALLRREVAAVGRVSSFGQVHTEGIPVGGLAPGGFADAYDVRPLWGRGDLGQGETIVFFEADGYSPADLAAYAARFGLPPFADPLPHIGPLNLKPAGESDMDLEAAHGIAPDANLVYVNLTSFGGKNASAASQFQQAFSTVAHEYQGAIWSVSLGQCEDIFSPTDVAAVNNAVKLAEQSGTSAFVASGDEGGLECLGVHQQDPQIPAQGISFPGDLPQVTSVGGTTLELTTAGQYLGETTWTEPLLSQGSTGGQSTMLPAPSWQKAPGVDSSYSDGTICGQPPGSYCREVPDVSADAAPQTGDAIRFDGKWVSSGGTSLATPVWAALAALIDQYLRSKGDHPVGFANPLLYQLARRSPPYPPYHDVTVGTNDFYPAGPGYDMVTGLGTPNAWNLARDLAPLTGRS